MKKGKGKTALMLLLAIVFLFSAGMTIRRQIQYHKIVADSEEAAQIAGLQSGAAARQPVPSVPVPSLGPDGPEAPPEPPPQEAAVLAQLNLEALRAVNGDVAGWIAIPGTELSYPLLQGEDNRYYLNRNWKKEPSGGGAVFLECTSSRDLTDYHTIVYAHRMRNDTMFGTLRHYEDLEYWRQHPCVYLATEAGVRRYEIFAAQEAGIKEIVYRLDIGESGLEEDFLRYCLEGSVIGTGITPEAGDRILTLSTCTGGHARRWVVHAVLRDIWTMSQLMITAPVPDARKSSGTGAACQLKPVCAAF